MNQQVGNVSKPTFLYNISSNEKETKIDNLNKPSIKQYSTFQSLIL